MPPTSKARLRVTNTDKEPRRKMPAEWEAHERTWMAWPTSGYTLGEDEVEAGETRQAWANVANAIVDFEPVSMLVRSADRRIAKAFLDSRVELVTADLNDAWMRDIGPTFVREGADSLVGINWIFNGWGGQSWAEWNHDARIATKVCSATDVSVVDSTLTNEGGGIHVNGAGTVLITSTVQLDPGRNPGWSREQVEQELARTIGGKRFIWLPRGLTRDYDEFGTRGHVDIVACFTDKNTVLYHDQRNVEHPDFWISAETKRVLSAVGRSSGTGEPEKVTGSSGKLRVIALPAPEVLQDDFGWVDYSYINHYVCNGAVIMCTFDDPADAKAFKILQKAYPTRTIVPVDARVIFSRGGGIHCITQQQPTR